VVHDDQLLVLRHEPRRAAGRAQGERYAASVIETGGVRQGRLVGGRGGRLAPAAAV